MEIKSIDEIDEKLLSEVLEIFFETSTKKTFDSVEEKELFIYRYLGYYQEYFSDCFFVMFDETAIGYICGSYDSFNDEALIKLQPQLEYFEEFSSQFPAHLHININPQFQGRGYGALLIDKFCEKLRTMGTVGVHVITTPNAKNKSFYKTMGFEFEKVKKVNGIDLLLLGHEIKSDT